MSYQEAYYFNKKSKEKALKEMEEKKRRQQYSEFLMPNTSTKVAQDNPTFTKNHHASMYEAMKKVNPRKWR